MQIYRTVDHPRTPKGMEIKSFIPAALLSLVGSFPDLHPCL